MTNDDPDVESLPDAVVEALQLDDAAAWRLTGGRVSKVWRCCRRGERVAVRQSPWFRTGEEVDWEYRVLEMLHGLGAPVVEPLAGPAVVDGSAWVAFRWAEGIPPVTPVDPRAYGRLLAELHNHSARLVGKLGQRPGWGRHAEFHTHLRGKERLSLSSTIDDWARDTGDVASKLRLLATEVHERLDSIEVASLPVAVIHGDFSANQVHERSDGTVTVLDWDFSHVDAALADIAIAASPLCRPSIDRAEAMIRGYLETAEQDPGDLSLLADIRRAFHLTNLANQVSSFWARGTPVSVDVISERLAREEGWGPLLVEAGARARRSRPAASRRAVSSASSDLEVAHELADRAAVAAMHFFRNGVVAELKADDSPVTAADHAVERLLRDSLAVVRPDDAVLGEEFGLTGHGARTWIIDPIDGTRAFAAGDPHWRVQIALRVDTTIMVAVVDEPATGRRWWATTGTGTFERQGSTVRRLNVSTRRSSHGATIAHYPPAVFERLPPHHTTAPRSPLGLVELIQGKVDAYFVDCCEVWDHAPWVLLVQEAGGRFTDHEGGTAPDKRGGLYSNSHLHDELLGALRPPIVPQ